MRYHLRCTLAVLFATTALAFTTPTHAQKTLRAVMNSDLKILDPIWTTAYVVRNHGYMIYDTLFATDANGEIKPQMIGDYEVSVDKMTYTFTLRDELFWHDGQPVTADDCVASIKRWAAKDSTGQKLMSFVFDMEAKDAKTFEMKLKEPTGLVLPLRHPSFQHKGHGRTVAVRLQEGARAAEGSRLRRHSDRTRSPTWRRLPRRSWRRPASKSTCSRWTGRLWSPAAPRGTCPLPVVGTRFLRHG
jgi:hypothetical protein